MRKLLGDLFAVELLTERGEEKKKKDSSSYKGLSKLKIRN